MTRCNRAKDCTDNSDEKNCHIVSVPDSYLKGSPPPPLPPMSSSVVTVGVAIQQVRGRCDTDLEQVVDVNMPGNQITVQFQMKMTWVDPRLHFNFLKANDLSPNLVPTLNNSGCSSIQLYEIWTPEILLFNTRDILSTSRIESDESSIVDIVQSGPGQFNSEENLDKVETFAGKENCF